MLEIITLFLAILAVGPILFRYTIGVWLCVVLLPLSATSLIGRQLFGITGLNPFNIVLTATLISFFIARIANPNRAPLPRVPLIFWLYCFVFVGYGVVGCFFIEDGMPTISDQGLLQPWSVQRYLLEHIAKPSLVLVVVFLVASTAMLGQAGPLLWAMVGGSGVLILSVLGFVLASGTTITALASAESREFLSWTGLHANALGLLLNMSTAVFLFTALSSNTLAKRVVLLAIAFFSVTSTLLTFSRGAFLGLIIMAMYYLLTRRQIRSIFIAFVVGAVAILTIPDAVYQRATTGLEQKDAEAISAGRATIIWPAMLPVFLENPLFGHGVASTLWTAPKNIGFYFGHPHNAYLASLLDFGILGSFIIAWFYVSICRRMRKFKSFCNEGPWRGRFESSLVCILLLMIQGFTGHSFTPSIHLAWMWVGVGLAFGYQTGVESARVTPMATGPHASNVASTDASFANGSTFHADRSMVMLSS